MSASGAGGPRVQRLYQQAANAKTLGGLIFASIGTVLFAFRDAAASTILTVFDVFLIPLGQLATELGNLVLATFGGAARIVFAGAIGTAQSVAPGGFFSGILGFTIAVGVVLLTLYLIRAYVSEEPTSNFFPGVPFDPPTPGLLDPEEDDKD